MGHFYYNYLPQCVIQLFGPVLTNFQDQSDWCITTNKGKKPNHAYETNQKMFYVENEALHILKM